ncbi:MAG: phospholipase D family protein [Nitrospirae bacterium]|nr:phospholipase D family protein [Nitrospirota bacterium]
MLRRAEKVLAAAVLIFIGLALPVNALDVPLNTTAHVYFSPVGGATGAIVAEIGRARSEILVQAYSFTSKQIADALVKARKAGVNIAIILDKSNLSDQYNAGIFTSNAGIPTYIDSLHNIAHNKVMIIDRETVITGSFNFTRSAEFENAENLIILKSRELANVYIANWNLHRQHSEEYKGQHSDGQKGKHRGNSKQDRLDIDKGPINRIFKN